MKFIAYTKFLHFYCFFKVNECEKYYFMQNNYSQLNKKRQTIIIDLVFLNTERKIYAIS